MGTTAEHCERRLQVSICRCDRPSRGWGSTQPSIRGPPPRAEVGRRFQSVKLLVTEPKCHCGVSQLPYASKNTSMAADSPRRAARGDSHQTHVPLSPQQSLLGQSFVFLKSVTFRRSAERPTGISLNTREISAAQSATPVTPTGEPPSRCDPAPHGESHSPPSPSNPHLSAP